MACFPGQRCIRRLGSTTAGQRQSLDSALVLDSKAGRRLDIGRSFTVSPFHTTVRTGRRRDQRLSAPCELEVRYLWRGDRPHEIETVQLVADAIEQPLTAAEERRHQVDLHLVHETGRENLLWGARPAGKRYILSSGRPARRRKTVRASGASETAKVRHVLQSTMNSFAPSSVYERCGSALSATW